MNEVTQPPSDVFGLTDSGKVRTSNEDHFVIATLRKAVELRFSSLSESRARGSLREASAQLLVVADGVGGRPGGEYASELTVQTLLEFITQAAGCFQAFDVDKEQQFLERMEQAVQHSHDLIRKEHGPRGHAPSTTLTMITLIWPRAYLVHAGDSRAYWMHRGRLRPLTQDQTMGEFMVDAGAWTEEMAARAKTAGTLTSAVHDRTRGPGAGRHAAAVYRRPHQARARRSHRGGSGRNGQRGNGVPGAGERRAGVGWDGQCDRDRRALLARGLHARVRPECRRGSGREWLPAEPPGSAGLRS